MRLRPADWRRTGWTDEKLLLEWRRAERVFRRRQYLRIVTLECATMAFALIDVHARGCRRLGGREANAHAAEAFEVLECEVRIKECEQLFKGRPILAVGKHAFRHVGDDQRRRQNGHVVEFAELNTIVVVYGCTGR